MGVEFNKGFVAGWNAARTSVEDMIDITESSEFASPMRMPMYAKAPARKKRKQSGKQKILTQMAKKAWDKYKKGNGKKTYIDIRAQVSRSQAYKKKTKGM